MPEEGRPRQPTGLRRLLLRAPVLLFRARTGWLFVGRLVLVEHVGRRTGARRAVVLEVVDRDRTSGAVTVASGFGRRADWYRNLRVHPEATMRAGLRSVPVTARPVDEDHAVEIMIAYGRRYPRTARRVARFMGLTVDGSAEGYAAVGRAVPFLTLVPRAAPPSTR
ncbi:nitroreductase family deazaflavin-dependent oxidoreductase [Actinoplanes sp. NPDC026623]|uniref:nitroreductase family deazaflavin-dependent oxidoreductase n=1 Tax=Actinoplanes sp. NPDC026623 TaxID=3155610 RepID=UPI0034116338